MKTTRSKGGDWGDGKPATVSGKMLSSARHRSTKVAAPTQSKEPMLENSKGVTNSLREASESVVASSWVTRYTELVEYKREFGNCCVPRRYKTNPKLGCWVSKQRQLFKSNQLAEHRIAELNEIGFTWEIDKEDAWMSCYNELVEYKREFGNCCVPQRYKTNPKLGSWVHNQRSLFKSNRLAKDHIEKLNEIGFTWGIDKEDAWKSRYNELVEYKKAFGDCCVPRRYKANPQLANWLQNEKDSALDQANKYSQHIKELGQALDPTQQDLDSKHEELTVAYSKLEALEEQLHNEVTMLHNRVSTLESQLNDKEHELAGVQDKKAAIAKECEKCTSESEELAIELERAEKKLKESELNAQQTEAVLKEQLNSLTSSLEAAGKEKKKNDQLMEELAGENEELLKELNSTKRDLDCARDEVTDLGKQVEQLKANLSEECQARQQFEQQKCDRASKVNSELEQRLRESIDECANLQNQIDSLKKNRRSRGSRGAGVESLGHIGFGEERSSSNGNSERAFELTDEEKITKLIESTCIKGKQTVEWEHIVGNNEAKDMFKILPISGMMPAYLLKGKHPREKNLGILLYGPPGTGKTMFAQALTKETDGIFIKVDPDDVFDPYFGNSEKKMRAVLNIASRESEKANKPTILFFDEIDGLLGEPGPNDCEAKTCLLKVFQTWMDGLEERTSTVIVVGATNFPDKLQEAILSRFGKQIHVGLPSVDDIVQIIKNDLQFRKQQCNLTVSEYKSLAQTIHHQEASGRDVTTLCKNTYDTIVIMAIKAKFWCKSNGKLYTPCNHGRGKGCGRKCSGEVPDNCRELHPWSLADFEAAIDKFGISMSKKKAFKY